VLQIVPVVLLDAMVYSGKPSARLGVDVNFASLEALLPFAGADLVHEHFVLEPRPTRMRYERLRGASIQFFDESDMLCIPALEVFRILRPEAVRESANAAGKVLEVDLDDDVELLKVPILAVEHLVLAPRALFGTAEHQDHHGVWKHSMDPRTDIIPPNVARRGINGNRTACNFQSCGG